MNLEIRERKADPVLTTSCSIRCALRETDATWPGHPLGEFSGGGLATRSSFGWGKYLRQRFFGNRAWGSGASPSWARAYEGGRTGVHVQPGRPPELGMKHRQPVNQNCGANGPLLVAWMRRGGRQPKQPAANWFYGAKRKLGRPEGRHHPGREPKKLSRCAPGRSRTCTRSWGYPRWARLFIQGHGRAAPTPEAFPGTTPREALTWADRTRSSLPETTWYSATATPPFALPIMAPNVLGGKRARRDPSAGLTSAATR